MRIIITAATEFELSLLKHKFKSTKERDVIFIATGIGMLATAVSLMHLIYDHKPDFIIQIGIAGGFNVKEKLGKVYLVEEEFLGDVGVVENGKWKDAFDLQLAKANSKPFKKKGLLNSNINKYNHLELPIVKGVTVNQISTDNNHIQQLIKKYNPIIETMEGAALHYVCILNNIPFLQIRSISNYIGERDKTKWKIKLALNNLSKTAIAVINHQYKLNKS